MALSDADYRLIGRGHLITLTTAEGGIYGLTLALYILCARSLYLQLEDRDQRKQRLFTLVYMTLLMALAFCNLALDSHNAVTTYVDHGDYPGGAYLYSSDVFRTSPVDFVGYAAVILLDFMTFGIQVWRLWIVWRASPYSLFIAAFPALVLLVHTGLEVANVVMIPRSESTPYLVNLFFYGEIGPPLCITVTVTLLITGRIAMVRRKNIKLIGQTDSSRPYTSVISMLIESFALEFVWMLCILGTSFSNRPVTIAANLFFMDIRPFIQVLAYLLVIHRVTMGREWKEDTAEKLTTLQWNRDGLRTTHVGTQASISTTYGEA